MYPSSSNQPLLGLVILLKCLTIALCSRGLFYMFNRNTFFFLNITAGNIILPCILLNVIQEMQVDRKQRNVLFLFLPSEIP